MRIIGSAVVVIFGLASSVLTILNFYEERVEPGGKVRLSALLSVFVFASFVGIVWQQIRYHRRSRYAGILREIGQIYLEIQTLPGGYSATREEIREGCKHVVNRLAKAMKHITGKPCSACIKTMVYKKSEGKDRACVVTLVRDDDSVDREQKSRAVRHWVDENFDFQQLHKDARAQELSFQRNFLPAVRNYTNTSFNLYGQPPSTWFTPWRDWKWTLPYKSTIVVPISPRPERTPATKRHEQVGYLCVDSSARFAFRKKPDAQLMAGIASCLYEIVYRYWSPEAKSKPAKSKPAN